MTGLRVVAIVQARMGSTRLPGKVLAEIGGLPMLVHVVERVRRCHEVHDVWVATTAEAADDAIERLCRERTYSFYRGSTQDVLDRYVQAGRLARADVIGRLTADCPLLDPALEREGRVHELALGSFFRSRECCLVCHAPVRGHRLARPHWAHLARGLVADGENEVHRRRILLRELVPDPGAGNISPPGRPGQSPMQSM